MQTQRMGSNGSDCYSMLIFDGDVNTGVKYELAFRVRSHKPKDTYLEILSATDPGFP